MDGVLFDFHAGWIKAYNEQFNASLTVQQVQYWNCWKITHFMNQNDWWTWLRTDVPQVFRTLPKYPDGDAALWQLKNVWGYRVTIITDKPTWAEECTRISLADNDIQFHDLVITRNKHDVECDVYVDDRHENLVALTQHRPGATIIRYKQPWNQMVDNTFTASNWGEVMDILKKREQSKWRPLTWR